MVAAGKSRHTEELSSWIKAVVNHLYWCAGTSAGNQDLILAKWESLVAHVADIHSHPDLSSQSVSTENCTRSGYRRALLLTRSCGKLCCRSIFSEISLDFPRQRRHLQPSASIALCCSLRQNRCTSAFAA
ncbi:unnamed protein product [Ixodes pacificus]